MVPMVEMTTRSKKIGDIEVTTLSDGVLAAPLDVVLGMDKAETERLAGRTGHLPIAVNAFLLRLGGKWALVDTGSGTSMGPTLGRLPDNLRAHGVAPDEIATIFLTSASRSFQRAHRRCRRGDLSQGGNSPA
jgi:glyoxylase-like metal-dependent hydrolase (beta-lactamase superfamily II)